MDTKNKEILRHQKKQKQLKKEIIAIKKKVPTYIVGIILFAFLVLYFFEDNFYNLFGNSFIFMMALIIGLGLFCVIIIYKNYITTKKKEKEIKGINAKLYKLMRLNTKDIDG